MESVVRFISLLSVIFWFFSFHNYNFKRIINQIMPNFIFNPNYASEIYS